MIDQLFTYIEKQSCLKLSEDDRKRIEDNFKFKKLRKRQYFLQEGDVCRYMGFIIKGATRMYSVGQKGHEHILRFSMEDWWVGDYESYTLLVPSRFNIDALEDTELFLISNEQIQGLTAAVPAISQMIKVMDQRAAIASQKRMHAAISLTAEERYDELYNSYPQLLQRFPQGMIASYLGISPETLSRIRKNVSQK
jgi:CRP-like cAMP-binding protein